MSEKKEIKTHELFGQKMTPEKHYKSMKGFKIFLTKAKKNSYALVGEKEEKRLVDGAKELVFSDGLFSYRDRYYGFDPFTGEEVVFYNKKPIWVMNYSGRCIGKDIPSKEIYDFLKKCLKKVNTKLIYRGPLEYKIGHFLYKNKIKEDVDYFIGNESIYFQGKKVYELNYSGVFLKN